MELAGALHIDVGALNKYHNEKYGGITPDVWEGEKLHAALEHYARPHGSRSAETAQAAATLLNSRSDNNEAPPQGAAETEAIRKITSLTRQLEAEAAKVEALKTRLAAAGDAPAKLLEATEALATLRAEAAQLRGIATRVEAAEAGEARAKAQATAANERASAAEAEANERIEAAEKVLNMRGLGRYGLSAFSIINYLSMMLLGVSFFTIFGGSREGYIFATFLSITVVTAMIGAVLKLRRVGLDDTTKNEVFYLVRGIEWGALFVHSFAIFKWCEAGLIDFVTTEVGGWVVFSAAFSAGWTALSIYSLKIQKML